MNTMPSTAPTSADACLSIVHSLMCHRVSETVNYHILVNQSKFVVAFACSKGANRRDLRKEQSNRW